MSEIACARCAKLPSKRLEHTNLSQHFGERKAFTNKIQTESSSLLRRSRRSLSALWSLPFLAKETHTHFNSMIRGQISVTAATVAMKVEKNSAMGDFSQVTHVWRGHCSLLMCCSEWCLCWWNLRCVVKSQNLVHWGRLVTNEEKFFFFRFHLSEKSMRNHQTVTTTQSHPVPPSLPEVQNQ